MKPHSLCLTIAWAGLLAACGPAQHTSPVVEVMQLAPLDMQLEATGVLKATQATPLQVPGKRWNSLKLVWLEADGRHVRKGQVVARFSATQSEQDLAQAQLDLARNTIARLGKQAELAQTSEQLQVDLTDVAWQLAIAERYANADLMALSRNKVLDAVQDKEYLGTRQDILQWRQGNAAERGAAALSVLEAKRDTLQIKAQQKQDELNALQLTAPHDGVFMLEPDWSGNKPHIGSSMFGGRSLAKLPDIASMEVMIAIPQAQAQGIKVGDTVQMHPLGQPDETATSAISWIAAAAQTRSRESPVKYTMMKATVPEQAISRFGWMPQQQFQVSIIVFKSDSALSVPNLAIDSRGEAPCVYVLESGKPVARQVELGSRGPSRTQIISGLEVGDHVVIDYKEHVS